MHSLKQKALRRIIARKIHAIVEHTKVILFAVVIVLIFWVFPMFIFLSGFGILGGVISYQFLQDQRNPSMRSTIALMFITCSITQAYYTHTTHLWFVLSEGNIEEVYAFGLRYDFLWGMMLVIQCFVLCVKISFDRIQKSINREIDTMELSAHEKLESMKHDA